MSIPDRTAILIDNFLREEGTHEEAVELTTLLREEPEVRAEYRRQAIIHSALQWTHGSCVSTSSSVDVLVLSELIQEAERESRQLALQEAEVLAETQQRSPVKVAPEAFERPAAIRRFAIAACTIAATLLAIIAIQPRPSAPLPVVATIDDSANARWMIITEQAGRRFSIPTSADEGQPIYQTERWRLEQGFADVSTLTGATLSLQAPCEIEFVSANHVKLAEGRLIAECNTFESKGFTVDTKVRRLVDLGTEFGVWIDVNDALFAEVFDGEISVEIISEEGLVASAKTLKQEGVLTVDGTGVGVTRKTKLDESPFTQLIAKRMGIEADPNNIAFLQQAPPLLPNDTIQSEGGLFVIDELGSEYELENAASVTFRGPGLYKDRLNVLKRSAAISKGTKIRSYLIYLDTTKKNGVVRRGRLTFSSEILGVICNVSQWDKFVAATSNKATQLFAPPPTLLETRHSEAGVLDWLQIDSDNRTLEYNLSVAEEGFDAIRVLVAE